MKNGEIKPYNEAVFPSHLISCLYFVIRHIRKLTTNNNNNNLKYIDDRLRTFDIIYINVKIGIK